MFTLKPLALLSLGIFSHLASGVALPNTKTISAADASCPDSNGAVIVDPVTGANFILECATDRSGGDILGPTPYTADIAGCVAACAANDKCVAASWVNGPCYLKSSIGFPSPNFGVTTVFKDGGASGLKCPSANNQRFVLNDDSYYVARCNLNRVPEPDGFGIYSVAPSYEECLRLCESRRDFECKYATFYPGEDLSPGKTIAAPGGKCVLSRKITVQDAPEPNAWWGVRNSVCPNKDGKEIPAGLSGRFYEIHCDSDWLYNDLPEAPIQTDSVVGCMKACDTRAPHCFGVVWQQAFPLGLCFFKSEKPGTIVPTRPGVIRAKLVAA